MAFYAFSDHLPFSIRNSALPPQYLVIVPATLVALVLAYTLTKFTKQLEGAHPALSTTKRSAGKSPTVLLVGLQESGKTALFSSLVYGTVPATLPSQVESQGSVQLQGAKPVNLLDLPGHPRLRPKLDEYINQADGIVICVDAVSATKSAGEGITQIADLVHSTLTSLAKTRQRGTISPTCVMILFTRADLSPLSGDEKRRTQLLNRCRTALEVELSHHRANMGLGSRKPAGIRIAGVGKVATDSSCTSSAGLLEWFKRPFSKPTQDQEEEEEQEDLVDYIQWGDEGAFSLEKLDAEVVYGGNVYFTLSSVGEKRGWIDANKEEGTTEVKLWFKDLQ